MAKVKQDASWVALIGDIVGSRRARDRQGLHDAIEAALVVVNREVPPLDPAVIVRGGGDEFQGLYPTLGDALRASFIARAELSPTADVRFGLGRGAVQSLDAARGIHDGPAWWAARDAIERTESRADTSRTRTARTGFASEVDDPAHVAAVQAALDGLDFVLGSLTEPANAILRGLLRGATQLEMAEQLGVSPSAVSQRVRNDGIGVALDVMTTLGELP